MYRIKVLTRGTDNNVEIGERYTFFISEAVRMATLFMESGCEFEISKFTRICFGVYCWSNCMPKRFYKKFKY